MKLRLCQHLFARCSTPHPDDMIEEDWHDDTAEWLHAHMNHHVVVVGVVVVVTAVLGLRARRCPDGLSNSYKEDERSRGASLERQKKRTAAYLQYLRIFAALLLFAHLLRGQIGSSFSRDSLGFAQTEA